jgi:hypothetical protein
MGEVAMLRATIALLVMAVLMLLVKLQINAAVADGYGTVEQLAKRGIKALSFDRHYAMPIDFAIFPGYVALCIFLCANQWTFWNGLFTAIGSWVAILFCLFVLWIGGTEAHVHDGRPTLAGYEHGVFAAIVVWTAVMVLVCTPKPEPVLLLVTCLIVPVFFFVGTHMFLGMINFNKAATTFSGNPLRDPVGWTIIIGSFAAVATRSYFLIPQSFWDELR